MKIVRFLLIDLWVKLFLWVILFPVMLLYKIVQGASKSGSKGQEEELKALRKTLEEKDREP